MVQAAKSHNTVVQFPRRDFDSLPFVKSKGRGKGFNYWAGESTGNYTADCDRGRRWAEELFSLPATNGNMTLLNCIARSMIENGPRGQYDGSGLVVGFMSRIFHSAVLGELVSRKAQVGSV